MKIHSTTPLAARRGDPRGQVLVLFALVLVVLLLVSALAIDYGGWLVTKRSYQNHADAASLAGAQQLTRPLGNACPAGGSKNFCAREAAWDSIKTALNLTALVPTAQAAGPNFTIPYVENGYNIWVASPPSDAGSAYLGHVSGPGVVYVRVEHQQKGFISSLGSNVTAWATAGRFPANFAVIGMCQTNCLAQDANIKLDGSGTNLIVNTGDLGTNTWVKTGGNSSGLGLGADSNAYMQDFSTCWGYSSNQCQLYAYSGGAIDYSSVRAAIPLGAPIVDPGYPAPPINDTTAPNQCLKSGTVSLAALPGVESGPLTAVTDLPIRLVRAVAPPVTPSVIQAAVKVTGTVTWSGTGVGGLLVELMNGATVVKSANTSGSGAYSMNGVANGTYTVRVTDPNAMQTYHQSTVGPLAFNADTVVNVTVQKNPVITGTVRNANTSNPISGATIAITGTGNYSTTTNGSGVYSYYVSDAGSYTVTATASGYQSNSGITNFINLEQTATVNINLTPAPASLTGTITDMTTSLPVPGVTVTLSTGQSTTTDAAGSYSFGSITPTVPTTVTLGGTSMVGYVTASPSNPPTPWTNTFSVGANTKNFLVWPKGCKDAGSARGDWKCSYPTGNNCPATTNVNGSNVTCTFTQANAIRPGTYHDIVIDGCAWLDPTGGVTGLAAGQSPGIYHITGTISMSGDSYLFGDGVTLVMNQGAGFDVNNGGGFVLNFGSQVVGGTCDLTTVKVYNDGTTPCFRTVSDGQDRAYAAWTTKGAGHSPWSCIVTTPPTYDTSCVQVGQELGVTFYLYGTGYGSASRFKLSTASMGYLFNGVLYGPKDDISLGGGKNGQSAAGQIVGYTIEYHGGTQILQNWYGDPVDGPPFLIEPILGE